METGCLKVGSIGKDILNEGIRLDEDDISFADDFYVHRRTYVGIYSLHRQSLF